MVLEKKNFWFFSVKHYIYRENIDDAIRSITNHILHAGAETAVQGDKCFSSQGNQH